MASKKEEVAQTPLLRNPSLQQEIPDKLETFQLGAQPEHRSTLYWSSPNLLNQRNYSWEVHLLVTCLLGHCLHYAITFSYGQIKSIEWPKYRYWDVSPGRVFLDYALLGDDIVIGDPRVAEAESMSLLGVVASEISDFWLGGLEFAKKFRIQDRRLFKVECSRPIVWLGRLCVRARVLPVFVLLFVWEVRDTEEILLPRNTLTLTITDIGSATFF